MPEPKAWRVTLTWPRPPEWGKPNSRGHVPRYQEPACFARAFAYQIVDGARLARAELRPRSVLLVAVVPASPARGSSPYANQRSSAQQAIDRVMFIATFGAALVGASRGTPLPEPVRIKVEPYSGHEHSPYVPVVEA